MTATRSYDQFCPIASALDAVGDRWALLVVRELVLGSRRFSQLAEGLPGISSDILTARLRALESAKIVRRVGDVRPAYELTEGGRALSPILRELVRWGGHRLAAPESLDVVRPRVALTALLLAPTEMPIDIEGCFELRTSDQVTRILVEDGMMTFLPEDRAASQVTTIDITHPGLVTLLLGGPSPDLLRSGDVVIHGNRKAARSLLDNLVAAVLIG
jgi:DNA-binding HxlR family transcriptional regulator